MNDKGTLWLPEGASTLSPELDSLFYFVYWISVVIFFAVVIAMTYFVFRYRRRDPSEIPPLVHESRILESAWIVLPTILVLIVFTWGFKAFIKLHVAPPDSYQIQVRAKQWLWEFEYPNGTTSVGDLHVPVDKPVRLLMSSEDVLHSFFVPAFRVKQDVIPNRYSTLWFEATRTGEFDIFCTEYCGTQHSGMLGKVVVQTEADFTRWIESAGVGDMSPVEYGALLFSQNNCTACHAVDGAVKVGPALNGVIGSTRVFDDGSSLTADASYVRNSIVAPGSQIVQGYVNAMPATYGTLDAAKLDAIVAYIDSLE